MFCRKRPNRPEVLRLTTPNRLITMTDSPVPNFWELCGSLDAATIEVRLKQYLLELEMIELLQAMQTKLKSWESRMLK